MENMNVHQQVFALSLMSNLAQGNTGTQADLQTALEQGLPRALRYLPGKWHIVWGPVVWKEAPDQATTGPDHVWFVARNSELAFTDGHTQDTYVLAIAATATKYNWIDNNAAVAAVVDFNQWVSKWVSSGEVTAPETVDPTVSDAAYISYGTARGVYKLASVAPPFSAVGGGVPLRSFWASFPASSQAKVIVTGHSLGGALSPTLALSLLESQAFTSFPPENILTYPTAGPSPGNLTFAKQFSERFPKVPGPRYEVWNCNIVNLRDIVSQAWCTSEKASPKQNLKNIPAIYGLPEIPEVNFGVQIAKQLAEASQILYFPLQAQQFKGMPPPTAPADMREFLNFTRHQHLQEFLNLFDIAVPQALTGEEWGVQRMTPEEVVKTRPVMNVVIAPNLLDNPSDEPQEKEDYSAITALCETF
ncbi:hypothetical protein RSAG8_11679, partial [Rhizoctonia solani AG-8 WAC10335]